MPGHPPKDPGICDDYLRHALAHPPRLLVIDEAHQLSAACIEYVRYLHDDPAPSSPSCCSPAGPASKPCAPNPS
ncbi:hypothetical protein [Streptomyces sp. NPDC006334]|uniref:hypothetical protein n=1 Tax=Streptomyces sp. NPDC006334 TaxID=3156754 RepID=UPI0033AAD0CE